MTGTLCLQWSLISVDPPRPWRHCPTCGVTRAFASSRKVRLNANGRRLDAWLIYRCVTCETTWLRPLLERAAVQYVPQADLDAMQQSEAAWVRQHEFDVATLQRYAERITYGDNWSVTKAASRKPQERPNAIKLQLRVPVPTGIRLDRFLSRELQMSRSRLRSLHARGGILVRTSDKSALRGKINRDVTVTLLPDAFGEAELSKLFEVLFVT
ncbi:MAG: DUF1062 domain-containing protein [Pseudomonadota bacterium]